MNDLDLVKLEMLEQRGTPADRLVMFLEMNVPITFGQIADFGVGGTVGVNESFDPFNEAALFFEARKALPGLLKLIREKDEQLADTENLRQEASDAEEQHREDLNDSERMCRQHVDTIEEACRLFDELVDELPPEVAEKLNGKIVALQGVLE